MKAVHFSKRSNNGIHYFSLQINTKVLGENISKGIVYTYIGISMICGLISGLAIWSCVEKSSINFNQFLIIVITGFIFMSLMRIINKEKFVIMENGVKQICSNLWHKVF